MAETTTTLTSFSLVYLTCIKIRTTSSALKVAMIRATIVLKGPRSIKATPAVTPVRTSKRQQQVVYLALTLVLGLAFLGVKAVEWTSKFEEHHVPGPTFNFEGSLPGHPDQPVDQHHAQLFFSLYFAMTGMHALHMIIGVGIFSYLLYHAWKGKYTPEYHTPLENSGLYWHFVDIVWIYLFPLLYLIDRKK